MKAQKYLAVFLGLALILSLGVVAVLPGTGGVAEAVSLPTNITCNTTGWWWTGNTSTYNATSTPIQDAVNNSSAGGVVQVEAGTYNENLVIATENITLNGAQHGVTAVGRSGAESTIDAADPNDYVVEIMADGVTLDGFTITGRAEDAENCAAVITQGVDNCTITNNILTDNYKDAINLFSVEAAYSDYNTVSNNVINGPAGHETFGIKVKGSHNTISGNHIYNTDSAIHIWSWSDAETASPDYNTISGNTIGPGDDTAAHKYGIDIKTGHHNAVTGNTITDAERAAIYLYTSDRMAAETDFDPRPANDTISDNTITGGEVGIALMEGANNNTISDNNITGTTVAGILGSLSRWPTDWEALTLAYTSDDDHLNYLQITGNTISGNTLSNCGHGIAMEYGDNNTLTGNTIEDNTGDAAIDWHGVAFTAEGRGVYFDANSVDNVVNYNNIVGNHGSGYGLENANTATTLDAENNWWGDTSGPGGAGHGTGDAVSANVDYDPWLDAAYPGGDSITFMGVKEEAVTDGTVDARTEASTEVDVDGTATVTAAKYSHNPGSGFTGDIGKYIDVHIEGAGIQPHLNKTSLTAHSPLFYTSVAHKSHFIHPGCLPGPAGLSMMK